MQSAADAFAHPSTTIATMRRGLGVFLAGLVVGGFVALTRPDLMYERRTVSLGGADRVTWNDVTTATTRDGWRVVRVDNNVLY